MISVILPIYNGGEYLNEALDSVVNQSFDRFELICIDDGSSDNTLDILSEYAKRDSRIIVVSRENRGLIYSLNEAISLSKYDYIARMDADDICHKDRFKEQLNYLKRHKNVAVIGSSYRIIDEKGTIIGTRCLPTRDQDIKSLQVFGSPFGHPTVMINKLILGSDYYYDANYQSAEDYELWLRLSKKYKFSILKKKLLDYRVLNTSISRSRSEEQLFSRVSALKKHIFTNDVSFEDIESFTLKRSNKVRSFYFLFKQKNINYIRLFKQFLYILLKWK